MQRFPNATHLMPRAEYTTSMKFARLQKIWQGLGMGYLIALHLLLAMLIVKTDFIPKVNVRMGWATAFDPVFPHMRRVHGWMDASVPDHAVIFLGDSIVQGLATAAVTSHAVNYGIGGTSAAQLAELIPLYESLPRAQAIVLSTGINDIIGGQTSALEQRYRQILNQLPATVPLVWSSVMPTRIKQISAADIDQANQIIKALCQQRSGCIHVDAWTLFNNPSHRLEQLLLEDGIHLSPAGYQLWIEALRLALADVAAKPASG